MWRAFDRDGPPRVPGLRRDRGRASLPMYWVRVARRLAATSPASCWAVVNILQDLEGASGDVRGAGARGAGARRLRGADAAGRIGARTCRHRASADRRSSTLVAPRVGALPLDVHACWSTVAVIVASLFEIIPTFLIRSNVPTIASVKPYTPLELGGPRHLRRARAATTATRR